MSVLRKLKTSVTSTKAVFFLVLWFLGMIGLVSANGLSTDSSSENTNPIPPNTILFTFAGQNVTSRDLSAVEMQSAQIMLQDKITVPSTNFQATVDTKSFVQIFDALEIQKQLSLIEQQKNTTMNIGGLISDIAPLPSLSTDEAYTFYNENPKLFALSGPSAHVREIVTKDSKTVYDILGKLAKGGDFAQLAQQYSQDPPLYRNNGGDLGRVNSNAMPPAWSEVVFNLPSDGLSSVFSMDGNYYIVQILGSFQYDTVPFSSDRDTLLAEKYLQHEQFMMWLSQRILSEPWTIWYQPITTPFRMAINSLKLAPMQENM
jgi:hypothetical protein